MVDRVRASCHPLFLSQRFNEILEFERAVMPTSIDEESRCAIHSAADATAKVFAHPRQVLLICQRGLKVCYREPKPVTEVTKKRQTEGFLVFENAIVHFPEAPTIRREFSSLGRRFGVWVNLIQREISEHKPQPSSEQFLDAFHNGMGVSAMRALI